MAAPANDILSSGNCVIQKPMDFREAAAAVLKLPDYKITRLQNPKEFHDQV